RHGSSRGRDSPAGRRIRPDRVGPVAADQGPRCRDHALTLPQVLGAGPPTGSPAPNHDLDKPQRKLCKKAFAVYREVMSAAESSRQPGASGVPGAPPGGWPSWFDPSRDVVLTPRRLRGLVHPVRVRLLYLLETDGPATASQL